MEMLIPVLGYHFQSMIYLIDCKVGKLVRYHPCWNLVMVLHPSLDHQYLLQALQMELSLRLWKLIMMNFNQQMQIMTIMTLSQKSMHFSAVTDLVANAVLLVYILQNNVTWEDLALCLQHYNNELRYTIKHMEPNLRQVLRLRNGIPNQSQQ